jgi:very-short-patch-repair endonuclease
MNNGRSKVQKLCDKYRKQNRKNTAAAEKAFLKFFKGYRIKVVQQYPIFTRNGFILIDFVIPKYRLAFEIDGSSHHNGKTKKNYDAWRERVIAKHGLALFRFKNEDVLVPNSTLIHFFKDIFKERVIT